MSALLVEIISILTAGITGLAQGIGAGLSELAQAMFIEVGVDGAMSLSIFGGLIVVFAGISLAVGLSRLIFGFVTSLGARK